MTTIKKDEEKSNSGRNRWFYGVVKTFLGFALVAFIGFIIYLATRGAHPDVAKISFVAGSFALTFTSLVLVIAGAVGWLDLNERFKDMDMRYGKDIDAKFKEQNEKIENIAEMIRNDKKERNSTASDRRGAVSNRNNPISGRSRVVSINKKKFQRYGNL